MARELLLGEKRICRVTVRMEEREKERIMELADERGLTYNEIIRDAIRQAGDLQPPENEYLQPWHRRGRL